MTLKERIVNDTYRVFLRVDDYADTHKICTNSKDSELVIASLQANEVDLSAGNGIALQAFSHTLYCAYPIAGKYRLNAGQILYIDDEAYKVLDLNNEMGIATIHLKRG